MEYRYSTSDPIDKIKDFYGQRSDCSPYGPKFCRGKADPFGVYNVIVRDNGTDNTIIVELAWDKCPNGKLLENSVEK